MTILDLQRRIAEAGRIRIGQQVATGRGGKRPSKLETFRLTSPDQRRIEQAAGLYGGKPAEWDAPAGKQWEVVTEADALDVIVPPTDMAFSQHYELWSAGGCQRRCDGERESITDGPCICDPDERECKIHTRLSVMLRDLIGLGVWRIDTQGYYAAVELQAAVGVIQMAAGRGQMLPARLRLEQRVVKRPNTQTRRFAVPVLDIEVSPGQLLASTAAPGQLVQAPAGEVGPGESIDGSAPLTPVPAALPTGPVASVAEQVAAPETAQRRPRRNAAAELPATGLAPRTAEQASAEAPPDEAPPPPEPPGSGSSTSSEGDGPTAGQHRYLRQLYSRHRIDDDQAHAFLQATLKISSHKDMTKAQMTKLIDWLDGGEGDPEGEKAAAKMRSIAAEQMAGEPDPEPAEEGEEPDADADPPDDGGVAALHAAQQRARDAQRAQGIAPEPAASDWPGLIAELGIHGRTAVALAKRVARDLGIDEPQRLADLDGIDHAEWQPLLTQALIERAQQDGSGDDS